VFEEQAQGAASAIVAPAATQYQESIAAFVSRSGRVN